jgi:hypothetical protein
MKRAKRSSNDEEEEDKDKDDMEGREGVEDARGQATVHAVGLFFFFFFLFPFVFFSNNLSYIHLLGSIYTTRVTTTTNEEEEEEDKGKEDMEGKGGVEDARGQMTAHAVGVFFPPFSFVFLTNSFS